MAFLGLQRELLPLVIEVEAVAMHGLQRGRVGLFPLFQNREHESGTGNKKKRCQINGLEVCSRCSLCSLLILGWVGLHARSIQWKSLTPASKTGRNGAVTHAVTCVF